MTAYEFVSIAVAVLGLIGGVIGFFRSLVAGRRSAEAAAKAADAQADATAALQKSAAAEERIARALETIAEHHGATPHVGASHADAPHTAPNTDESRSLAEALRALIPAPVVQWQVEPRLEAGSYRLRNTGTVVAIDVTVNGAGTATRTGTPTPAASRLLPGQALNIGPGLDERDIEVVWRDAASAQLQSAHLPLPPSTSA